MMNVQWIDRSAKCIAITIAAVLFTAALSGCASAKNQSGQTNAWNELIGDRGLDAWTCAPKYDPAKFADSWMTVGSVKVPDQQTGKLLSEPGKGVIVNGENGRSYNLVTKQPHADIEAHIEFMVPKGSNSGVYFMGRYELQILDSWGREKVVHGDCGGIYQRWDPARGKGKEGFEGHPPRVNASRAPGQWQRFDVIFRAPRFDAAGQKIANAKFVKVVHNGVVVHENVEVTGPTRAACFNDEKPTGPLMLQGDHGPVAYRNIRIRSIQ